MRTILVLLFIFHVAGALLFANPESYVTRVTPEWMRGYFSTLGLNSTWQLFAPNPGSALYLNIAYMGANDNVLKSMSFPEREVRGGFDAFFFRRLYLVKTLVSQRYLIEKYFAPWLCRQLPTAKQVLLEAESHSYNLHPTEIEQPDLVSDIDKRTHFQSSSYECNGPL